VADGISAACADRSAIPVSCRIRRLSGHLLLTLIGVGPYSLGRYRIALEFVGAFHLLSAIALSEPPGALGRLALGAAFMVYVGGHLSRAHYNLAVSFGVFLCRKLNAADMVA
jgi:hypothetical protein